MGRDKGMHACLHLYQQRATTASGVSIPTYPLVRGLVTRGHKLAILGQPAQAEATRELGATFVPLDLPDWTPGKSFEEKRDVALPLLFGPTVGDAVSAR